MTAAAIVTMLGLAAALLVPRMRRGDTRYRDILLVLIAFTIPLRTVSLLAVAAGNVRIGDLFILAAAVMVVLEWTAGGHRLRATTVDVLLALFVVWCIVTLAWSLDPRFGITRALMYLRDLVLYAVVVFWSRDRFAQAFRAISLGVLLSFVIIFVKIIVSLLRGPALENLVSGVNPSFDVDAFRGMAGIGAATFAQGGSVLALAFWAILGIFFWLARGGWTSARRGERVLFFAVLTALLLIEVATFSRGAWVALAIAGLWWYARIGPDLRRGLLVPAIALLVLGSLLAYRLNLYPAVRSRISAGISLRADPAIDGRFRYWQGAIDALEGNPMGVGLGGTTTTTLPPTTGSWFIHNLYLQLLAETGPVGLALVLAAFALAITQAVRTGHLAAISLAAMLVSYLVMGLTFFDFADLLIWMVFALASSVYDPREALD